MARLSRWLLSAPANIPLIALHVTDSTVAEGEIALPVGIAGVLLESFSAMARLSR